MVFFVAHGNHFHFVIFFDQVENTKSINSEFPRRDRIWLKRLFLSRTDRCIHSQVSQYACDNDALTVYVEVIEVLLRTFL